MLRTTGRTLRQTVRHVSNCVWEICTWNSFGSVPSLNNDLSKCRFHTRTRSTFRFIHAREFRMLLLATLFHTAYSDEVVNASLLDLNLNNYACKSSVQYNTKLYWPENIDSSFWFRFLLTYWIHIQTENVKKQKQTAERRRTNIWDHHDKGEPKKSATSPHRKNAQAVDLVCQVSEVC